MLRPICHIRSVLLQMMKVPMLPDVASCLNTAAALLRQACSTLERAAGEQFLAAECSALADHLQQLSSRAGLTIDPVRLPPIDTVTDLHLGGNVHRLTAIRSASSLLSIVAQSLRRAATLAEPTDATLAQQLATMANHAVRIANACDCEVYGLQRLFDRPLHVLVDGRASEDQFAQLADAILRGGTPIVQLRDKSLDDRTLLERGRLLRKKTRECGALLIMNDRPDLALLVDADGVHVGQEDLPVADVRRIVGPQMLIGVSTHSIDQARQAVLDGANYIGVGPIFPSATKSFDRFPGLELLRQVRRELAIVAFAIGGINAANIESVVTAGATHVAVSHAVVGADDPQAAAVQLLAKIRMRCHDAETHHAV